MELNEQTKIAVVAIIITDSSVVDSVNSLLHEFRDFVVGRQGIPYKSKGVNIITIIIDASNEVINSLSGKLGMIKGVKSKVLTTK